MTDRIFVFIHSPIPENILRLIKTKTILIGFANQAVYDSSRYPAYYRLAHMLIPASRYIEQTLLKIGAGTLYEEPIYGVCEIARKSSGQNQIFPGALVDWDKRKFRDKLIMALSQFSYPQRKTEPYRKKAGLTLGIVSRLANLKQFPLLLGILAPKIAQVDGINLEIFGQAVGYRSFSEIKRATKVLGDRVRFWGHQVDVTTVYRQIDILLTGLPEREGLGYNVLEAQGLGVPVLAPDGAPFDETVISGVNGYRYVDPRTDGGDDFFRILVKLKNGAEIFDHAANSKHLSEFSFDALRVRLRRLIDHLEAHY